MAQDVFDNQKLTFSEPVSLKLVNFDTVLCFTETEKVSRFWNQLYLYVKKSLLGIFSYKGCWNEYLLFKSADSECNDKANT